MQHRRRWAALAGVAIATALWAAAPSASAQEPGATEHPIPTTPPGATATRPPGPWVDPPPPPDGCAPEAEPNDRPEQEGAHVLAGEFCVSGTLEVTSDQDLYFWEVPAEDGLTTWDVSIRGVPTTYTSVHIFELRSEVGVTPIDRGSGGEVARLDSDVWIGTPVPTTGIRLAPGPYLLGISRALPGFKQDMTDDLSYWVDVRRAESALPPAGDSEPNDGVDTAIPVEGAFTLSGDAGDGRDMFRWQVPADSDTRAWRIAAHASVGSSLDLHLRDADGERIAVADAYEDQEGRAILHDLGLTPGTYLIEIVSNMSSEPYTLTTEAVGEAVDLEPNDEREQEVVIDPTTLTATGRLTSDRDVDRFVVDLDADLVRELVDVTLAWTDGAKRQLCLYTAAGDQIACGDSWDRVSFPGLMLAPGRTQLRVDGAGGLDSLYTLSLVPAGVPQGPLEVEPNDDIATANPVAGAFMVSGDLTGGSDFFAWTLSEADAAKPWHLDISSTPGNVSRVEVQTPEGVTLDDVSTTRAGDGRLWDLRLAPGTWLVRVIPSSSEAVAYQLRAVVSTDSETDPEPNRRSPVLLDPVTLAATGRLATNNDLDTYSFDVTDAMAATLTQVDLVWPGEQERRLCIAGPFTQCTSGIGDTRLPALDLAPGSYTLEITGDASTESRYDVRVTAGPPRAPDAESEPNDREADADDWDPALAMHGTSRGREVDTYRVRMPLGVPHRWRLDILGDGLEVPRWTQPDGTVTGSASRSDDASGAVIDDLMLVSGDHYLEVWGQGDYVLTLTDLGALDPLAETEPNDDAEHAGRLAWDVTRNGRLATPEDADVYRFSLAAPEHVVVTAVPDLTDGGSLAAGGVDLIDERQPVRGPQGLLDIEVISSEMRVAHVPGPRGGPTVLDALLPPGDHEVWLRTATRGGLGYTITLERDDPFRVPGTAARPASPVTLTLSTETPQVAAYIDEGQLVDAVLSIENASDGELDLALSALTTDLRWTVSLPATTIVPPGGTADIPVRVAVPQDAWRDIPVRVTVAARAAAGAQTTTSLDITPVQDAVPVAPVQVWSVPDAMLGGLDVARVDLGGVPGGSVSSEASVHDGYAVAGAGISEQLRDGSLELTVDLAGEDPVPVAGTIVNASSPLGRFADRPRDIELWLSLDGSTYQQVLAVEAGPVTTDQAFALPAPVDARYARLVIRSTWATLDPEVVHQSAALGEWKVVAAPGWAPAEPFDVAAAGHGGHIVWSEPDIAREHMWRLLDGTDTDVMAYDRFEPEDRQDVVLGFQDDRAAQVTRLEWVEQPGTDPARRFAQAQVEVSTTSPFGPWRSLGTWDLTVAPDGTVAPFELPEGTWARFVHLSIEPPADQERDYRTQPGQIRVIEHAAGDGYRSILGEWGQTSPRGPFDLLVPAALAAGVPDDADGPEDPAQAEPVAQGQVIHGRVARSADVDWYQVTVPPDQNQLTLRLGSERTNGVRMTILDADGQPSEFEEGVDRATGERVWTAYVKPGEVYRVGIEQPLLSVLIAFDTSGSVQPWWPLIRSAVRTFVDDVTPGQEAALVLPYAEEPLPGDWTDQAWLVQAALDARSRSAGSSCLRCAIDKAVSLLVQRDGARAVLVLGDAVGGEMYGGLDEKAIPDVDPSVFAVHFGAAGDEAESTAVMQDLSRSNGGHYQYATSTGEVDRAFDRMATWLRRPAGYSLVWEAAKLPPGAIGLEVADGAQVRIGGVAVELILDTSGSMDAELGRRKRIDVAKRSLSRLVEDSLPEGLPVALRVFKAGTRAKPSCATNLAVKLGPLDTATMLRRIDRIKIGPGTRTPLAAAIEAAAGDIGGVEGPRIVVVVTDGAESCKGDPEAAIRSLVEAGFDTTVNIVGLALDDEALKEQMARWAVVGGGTFFDAQDQAGLSAGMAAALRAPFRVYDDEGVVVGQGIVGDAAVTVQPGTYRVEVLSEPPIVIEDVEVSPASGVQLTVGGED